VAEIIRNIARNIGAPGAPMKPKRKLSRLAGQALREAREGVSRLEAAKALVRGDATIPKVIIPSAAHPITSWTEMGGPGDTAADLFLWTEEQNIIDHATGKKVKEGGRNGGRRNPNDLEIWQEFQQHRQHYPKSQKSDTALTEEIGRKYGLGRSAAIEARKRGEKLEK
jgi:hypothetical protein